MRAVLFRLIAVSLGLLTALVALEGALRLYHGQLLSYKTVFTAPEGRLGRPFAAYHPHLGWVPKPGRYEHDRGWTHTTDSSGLRSNGSAPGSRGRSILVVGDSFVFGDEVEDHETWPAHLENMTGHVVLNGGVFAYGIDQAFLRAEQLTAEFDPGIVVLAFIGHDVNRTELAYYQAWKPYYESVDGRVVLRNIPVPRGQPPTRRFSAVRAALSYSFLANALLRRTVPGWWYFPTVLRVHTQGSEVVVHLLSEMDRRARKHERRFLAVALPSGGRIGSDDRTPAVVAAARAAGVDVLDLLGEFDRCTAGTEAQFFAPGGHYTNEMNVWVASRVRDHLKPTEPDRPGPCPSIEKVFSAS